MSHSDQTYSYQLVSDYFIALANETQTPITNLKLQKLVYYAQAWNLAILDKQLFSEDFEAWIHGPVIPALYQSYSAFSWRPIVRDDLNEDSLQAIVAEFSPDVLKVIKDVEYEYFGMEAYELEKLTHNEDPWIISRDGLPDDVPSNNIITKYIISSYYKKFVANEQNQ